MRLLGTCVLVIALATATAAEATVPPKNCGIHKVGSRKYQIKADQIKCSKAVPAAKAYLRSRKVPRGFRCRSFTGSKMTFRCSKRVQVFFAIRR